MRISERYEKVLDYFSKHVPVAETELHYEDPFQLLVAVILSAQCTDKRVNQITPELFRRFPTVRDMAKVTAEDIFPYISSCSYPNSKAKHLAAMSKMIVSDFGGHIPDDIQELQKLPGVGRKTANVVAAVIYNKPAMPVDTHVFRVSRRIGLTWNARTPLQAEQQLTRHIPASLIPKAHHWLILHGRYVCQARKPKCHECGLKTLCRYYNDIGNKNKNP